MACGCDHLFAEPIDAELEGLHAQAARLRSWVLLPESRLRAHRGHFGGKVWAGSCNRSGPDPRQRCSTWLGWTGSQRQASAIVVLRAPTERRARSLGGGQACGSRSRSTPERARTGQRGLGDETRLCSGQLPIPRYQGYDRLATRTTQSNLRGAAFDSWAGCHTYHLSRPVAATVRGPLKSGSMLGTQTPVSSTVPRNAIRSFRCDRRRLPGAVHLALGDDRPGGQAQLESSFLCGVAPHDRARSVRGERSDYEGLHCAHGGDCTKAGTNPGTEPAPSRRDWPQFQGGRQREQEAGQRKERRPGGGRLRLYAVRTCCW